MIKKDFFIYLFNIFLIIKYLRPNIFYLNYHFTMILEINLKNY